MSFELIPALWRERDYSIMHAHTLGRLGGVALTIAKRHGVPFVVSIHGGVYDLPAALQQSFNQPLHCGWEWGRPLGWVFQSHRLFKDADAILTCNEREAALLQERLPDRKIVVQPHGVPTNLYQQDRREAARSAFPQIRNRHVLLCLGRIDPVKNQGWVVDQAGLVVQKHPRALLVLAGPCTDEAYQSSLLQKINQRGLRDHVFLTGALPQSDPRLIGLLQVAEALLLPSVSETFGLVILEAWSAGTVVLAARASGPAALIRDGHNGWLFDLEAPATFHNALDWALAHPGIARQMAQEGASLSEQYSVHALAGKMKALYQQLTEEKNALRNHSRRRHQRLHAG